MENTPKPPPREALRVLLVEDDNDHAELILRCFEMHGFPAVVERLTDGEAALDYVFARRGSRHDDLPHVILLDLRLPKVSGLDVLRSIKESHDLHTIPIIVLTTSAAERDLMMAYERHANSYLVKPTDFGTFDRLMAEIGSYWLDWNAYAHPTSVPTPAVEAPDAASEGIIDVLLVEDDEAHAELVRRVFEEHPERYQVVVAPRVDVARRLLAEIRPEVVVADWVLPDGRGIDVLPATSERALFPVLVLTSQGNEQAAVDAMKAGALDYVVKSPSSLADLPHTVERALREWRLIVQRRRADEEMRALNAELEGRVAERTSELEAVVKEQEAFNYSIAHDLRAPLRAINGWATILERDYMAHLDSMARTCLDRMREGTTRMGHLLDDLLALSRSGRQPLSRTQVEIAPLVRQALDDLAPLQHDRRVVVTLGELAPCQADPTLLQQVVVNLLSNAIKFTRGRDPARIEVGHRLEGSAHLYFVRDNGVGFDMRYAERVFGVFQRLHADEEFEGTGVGLAIVERIVARHGGRVWIDSALDHGTTVSFTIAADASERACLARDGAPGSRTLRAPHGNGSPASRRS